MLLSCSPVLDCCTIEVMNDAELQITADLARISLSDEERARLRTEVETMLTYFDSMASAEAALGEAAANAACDNAAGAGNIVRSVHALRDDRVRDDVNADDLIDAADEVEDRFIAIPNVL